MDLKVSREVLVCLETLDHLARQDPLGVGDHLVMRVQLEWKAKEENLDPRDHRDPQERMVRQVQLVPLDLPDLLERLIHPYHIRPGSTVELLKRVRVLMSALWIRSLSSIRSSVT